MPDPIVLIAVAAAIAIGWFTASQHDAKRRADNTHDAHSEAHAAPAPAQPKITTASDASVGEIRAALAEADVWVDPRYGWWDPANNAVRPIGN